MGDMPVSLFAFILEYVKFFANPEMQEKIWANSDVSWEEYPCDFWIKDSLREWSSIRKNLSESTPLIHDIDDLVKELAAYLNKILTFQEGGAYAYAVHRKILKDYDWAMIQRKSKIIFQRAREVLDS